MERNTSWTCTQVTASTSNCVATGFSTSSLGTATSAPLYVQDSGNLSFGVSILIFLSAMMFMGLIFNKFAK